MAITSDYNKLVSKTVEVYNRHIGREVKARLIDFNNQDFTIEFEGEFTQICGVNEYFEEFKNELNNLEGRIDLEIHGCEETGNRSYKVRYIFKNLSPDNDSQLFLEYLRESELTFEEYQASNACSRDVIRFHYKTWLFEKNKLDPKL